MRLNLALRDNIEQLKKNFGHSTDLVVRELTFGSDQSIRMAVVYIECMADRIAVYHLLESLSEQAEQMGNEHSAKDLISRLRITVGNIQYQTDFEAVQESILSGDTVILIDQVNNGIAVETKGFKQRSVSEPVTQTVVRGSQEGFTETLQTNVSLIRRRIKDPNLWLETNPIGKISKTSVAMMYINGLVKEETLQEVRKRLGQINIDAILESNYVEEFIQDKTMTVFPTINNTERPDTAAAALLEGRIAILIDGTPFVLLVPAVFTQFLQSAEDYYHRSDLGLIRALRFVAFFYIALWTCPLYRHHDFPSGDDPYRSADQSGRPKRGDPLPRFY